MMIKQPRHERVNKSGANCATFSTNSEQLFWELLVGKGRSTIVFFLSSQIFSEPLEWMGRCTIFLYKSSQIDESLLFFFFNLPFGTFKIFQITFKIPYGTTMTTLLLLNNSKLIKVYCNSFKVKSWSLVSLKKKKKKQQVLINSYLDLSHILR